MIKMIVLFLAAAQGAPPPVEQDPWTPDGITLPKPANPYQGVLNPSVHQGSALNAQIIISTEEKLVTLKWGFEDGSGESHFAYQTVPLTFWPTAASALGDKLLVAGLRRNGWTKIEQWSFDYEPVPSGPEIDGTWAYAPIISRETLYNAGDVGRRGVRFMFANRGVAGKAFVHFADSQDLFQLDVAGGSLSEVQSSDAVPALAISSWSYVWAARHVSAGIVYVYQADLDGPPVDPLVFVDADLNGTLDSWLRPDGAEWESVFGENDQVNWPEPYGR